MNRTKTLINLIFALILILVLFVPMFILGVSATWNYTLNGKPIEAAPLFNVGAWSYNADQIKNSVSDKITQGNDANPASDTTTDLQNTIGLNNPNSALSKIVKKRQNHGFDTFSSVDKYNEDNIRTEMGLIRAKRCMLPVNYRRTVRQKSIKPI